MTAWLLSRIGAVAIILAVPVLIANCSRVSYAALNAPTYLASYQRYANIHYGGPGERQSLDVYVPPGAAKKPVVVFWYGGTWSRGAKEWYRFVGASLASSGYVAVLPDYRLYPKVRFPTFIEDGAQALKWVHEHAHEFGGDPDAIFLMGHSAGAHLAASLALDPRYLRKVGGDPSWVRGWIGISGPYALDPKSISYRFLKVLFQPPYTGADWQITALAREHSPPTLLLHGSEDIFPAAVINLDANLRGYGNYVECHVYQRVGHVGTVAAFSLPFRWEASSLEDTRRFIANVLAGKATARSSVPCTFAGRVLSYSAR
jgi:acetyl esterase/lipase